MGEHAGALSTSSDCSVVAITMHCAQSPANARSGYTLHLWSAFADVATSATMSVREPTGLSWNVLDDLSGAIRQIPGSMLHATASWLVPLARSRGLGGQ